MGVSEDHKTPATASPELGRSTKRRKLDNKADVASGNSISTAIDLTADDGYTLTKAPRSRKPTKNSSLDSEKRLRPFRANPPQSFLARQSRAANQRMFVIDRRLQGNSEAPELVFDLIGSTGNLYETTICKMPRCSCPDAVKGNQCKHIIYVICNVLKATGQMRYQLAYLSSELREIFEHAPEPKSAPGSDTASNRKAIEGDCPICFLEMEPGNDVIFCRSSCGNNVHKACFQQWAKSHRGGDQQVRCVYCRSSWEGDDEALDGIRNSLAARRAQGTNHEGYVNVADELGISSSRDFSSYHQPWVRQYGRTYRYENIL